MLHLPMLVGLAALVVTFIASAAEAKDPLRVDANLITGLDASFSVGREEERLQREGLARAIADPAFVHRIRSGPHKRVGFAVFAWSSHGNIKLMVPWTVVATESDAIQVSDCLMGMNLLRDAQGLDPDIPSDHYEVPISNHLTDIAGAIASGSAQLRAAPFVSSRGVINIVGNGPSNSGGKPAQARDAALQDGYIINALLFGPDAAGLVSYYRSEVIGGTGSFVIEVPRPETMADAFVEKFHMDVAGFATPVTSHALLAFEVEPRSDGR